MGGAVAEGLSSRDPSARTGSVGESRSSHGGWELVPGVVAWNRGVPGPVSGHPLRDARVAVRELDVGDVLRAEPGGFDAILLDVDNGPEGLTRPANDALYGEAGLALARTALRPLGALWIWSAGPQAGFGRRLRRAGFAPTEHGGREQPGGKGARRRVWEARRPRE